MYKFNTLVLCEIDHLQSAQEQVRRQTLCTCNTVGTIRGIPLGNRVTFKFQLVSQLMVFNQQPEPCRMCLKLNLIMSIRTHVIYLHVRHSYTSVIINPGDQRCRFFKHDWLLETDVSCFVVLSTLEVITQDICSDPISSNCSLSYRGFSPSLLQDSFGSGVFGFLFQVCRSVCFYHTSSARTVSGWTTGLFMAVVLQQINTCTFPQTH